MSDGQDRKLLNQISTLTGIMLWMNKPAIQITGTTT
jgi:hypothetical protein